MADRLQVQESNGDGAVPASVIVPCVPPATMLREGGRAIQAWADETLREEVDDHEMARRVWKAMTSNA